MPPRDTKLLALKTQRTSWLRFSFPLVSYHLVLLVFEGIKKKNRQQYNYQREGLGVAEEDKAWINDDGKECASRWWTQNTIYRWCVMELYTWNLYNSINQCHPNKLLKKNYTPHLGYSWISPLILIIRSPILLLKPLLLTFPQNHTPTRALCHKGSCTDSTSQTSGRSSRLSRPVLRTLTHLIGQLARPALLPTSSRGLLTTWPTQILTPGTSLFRDCISNRWLGLTCLNTHYSYWFSDTSGNSTMFCEINHSSVLHKYFKIFSCFLDLYILVFGTDLISKAMSNPESPRFFFQVFF